MKWGWSPIGKTVDLENILLSVIALLVVLLINKPEDFATAKNVMLMELQSKRIGGFGVLKNFLLQLKKRSAHQTQSKIHEAIHS